MSDIGFLVDWVVLRVVAAFETGANRGWFEGLEWFEAQGMRIDRRVGYQQKNRKSMANYCASAVKKENMSGWRQVA